MNTVPTDIELKALAYDNLVQIEQSQANLKLINQEIQQRKAALLINENNTMEEEKIVTEEIESTETASEVSPEANPEAEVAKEDEETAE